MYTLYTVCNITGELYFRKPSICDTHFHLNGTKILKRHTLP